MKQINELPYAKWLEDVLRDMVEFPVESIYILTKLKDGVTTSTYYNCNMNDKLLFAGLIQQDAMMDTLRVNGYIGDDIEEDEEVDG